MRYLEDGTQAHTPKPFVFPYTLCTHGEGNFLNVFAHVTVSRCENFHCGIMAVFKKFRVLEYFGLGIFKLEVFSKEETF
jgi:hypothetical protein